MRKRPANCDLAAGRRIFATQKPCGSASSRVLRHTISPHYPSDDYCGILEGYFEATGNGEGDEADASSDDASRRGKVVTDS